MASFLLVQDEISMSQKFYSKLLSNGYFLNFLIHNHALNKLQNQVLGDKEKKIQI